MKSKVSILIVMLFLGLSTSVSAYELTLEVFQSGTYDQFLHVDQGIEGVQYAPDGYSYFVARFDVTATNWLESEESSIQFNNENIALQLPDGTSATLIGYLTENYGLYVSSYPSFSLYRPYSATELRTRSSVVFLVPVGTVTATLQMGSLAQLLTIAPGAPYPDTRDFMAATINSATMSETLRHRQRIYSDPTDYYCDRQYNAAPQRYLSVTMRFTMSGNNLPHAADDEQFRYQLANFHLVTPDGQTIRPIGRIETESHGEDLNVGISSGTVYAEASPGGPMWPELGSMTIVYEVPATLTNYAIHYRGREVAQGIVAVTP